MRFDDHKFDGVLLVGANRSRGIWCNQVETLGARVTRNGGRLNTSASNHTLLSVALLSALRSITAQTVAKLLAKRRDGRTKVALQVNSLDATFFPALTANNQQEQPTLQAARSLHRPLAKQLARFDLTFETERENNAILAALNWAANNVLDPIGVDGEPPVLVPSIVSGLGREFHLTGDHVRF